MTSAPTFRVLIRRNADGVERWCGPFSAGPDNEAGLVEFDWMDNNHSCDCNRSLWFARAAGESDDTACDCGEDGYDVRSIKHEDGRVLAYVGQLCQAAWLPATDTPVRDGEDRHA